VGRCGILREAARLASSPAGPFLCTLRRHLVEQALAVLPGRGRRYRSESTGSCLDTAPAALPLAAVGSSPFEVRHDWVGCLPRQPSCRWTVALLPAQAVRREEPPCRAERTRSGGGPATPADTPAFARPQGQCRQPQEMNHCRGNRCSRRGPKPQRRRRGGGLGGIGNCSRCCCPPLAKCARFTKPGPRNTPQSRGAFRAWSQSVV